MQISWIYLPNVRPYIVDGSTTPRQLADGSWVLTAVLSDGSNFSGRNEGFRSDITEPVTAHQDSIPVWNETHWEWKKKETFADRQDFKDACTPRSPKPEWFEKWSSWWLWVKDDREGPSGLVFIDGTDGAVYTEWEDLYSDDSKTYQGFNGTQDGCGYSWKINNIVKCLPVKSEDYKDYPIPVGWGVVEP